MAQTAARLLTLLGLLQARPRWTAPDLAERTGVQERTIRKDVTRLRELGYPIESELGRAGGYRLGTGSRVPPLMLDDDEAVTVAVALGLMAQLPGVGESGDTVLAKLEQTLPHRLRLRVRAVHDHLDIGPANTGTNLTAPAVDASLLNRLGAAIRDHQGLRITYSAQADGSGDERGAEQGEQFEIDPYRLVSWQERWFLVARDRRDGRFAALRADWLTVRSPDASRFNADPLDGEDYASFVLRAVASAGWAVHSRILVDAPADVVRQRINPAVGVVEAIDDQHSVLVTGADSYEIVAVWIGMLGLDFHITGPPELADHLQALARRYENALPAHPLDPPVRAGRRRPPRR